MDMQGVAINSGVYSVPYGGIWPATPVMEDVEPANPPFPTVSDLRPSHPAALAGEKPPQPGGQTIRDRFALLGEDAWVLPNGIYPVRVSVSAEGKSIAYTEANQALYVGSAEI